jgi:small-conductance mechanosensitive channel
MSDLIHVLDDQYLGNTTGRWLLAAAIFVVAFLVLLTIRRLFRSQYERLLATPQAELMEYPLMVASRTSVLFLLFASLYGASRFVTLPATVVTALTTIFTIAAFWQVGGWASTAVRGALERRQKAVLATDRAAAGSLGIIGFLVRATIWSLVLMLTLDNLGVQIKPLLAGLGIGGIAVALAVQNVLGDLFASLSITLDRPFIVGDSLNVDGISGTVEYIGVKSTRLRSPDGEQIIMPNSNLLSSRVRNLSRMKERRVVLTLSLSQETPRGKLAHLPGVLRSLIEAFADVRFDRAHFARIAASSFDIEAVYVVTTPDYKRHMDILQQLQLQILEVLERERVSLARPMQLLRVERPVGVESELVGGQAS